MISVLFFLAACGKTGVPLESDPQDSGVETGDSHSAPPVVVDPFDGDMVHQVDLVLSKSAEAALRADPYEYVVGDVTLDDVTVSEVGVRIKGRSGSFRDLDSKTGFKVDVDREHEQTLGGLRKFNLNNMVVDCSFVKEHLALPMFRAAGVPSSRVSYAWLRVNGEDFGLYNLVEDLDSSFLAQNFEDAEGNLYDGDYVQEDDGFESQVDFNLETQDYFDLDEGEDVDRADIHAVTAALDAGGDLLTATEGLLTWDGIWRMLAVEARVGQVDGYGLQSNNYRVYFDPFQGGEAVLLPWDLDYSFIDPDDWDESWDSPMGRLLAACLEDEPCRAGWEEVQDRVDQDLAVLDLVGEVDAHAAQVEDLVRDDPRWECSWDDHLGEVAYVREWVGNLE